MPFTGNEDQEISLEEASKLTERYREATGGAILGGYISQSALKKILDQDDCVGIRYYYGQEEDGTPQAVIVGVLANEDDIYEGRLAERSILCPPTCGKKNSLNS